MTLTLIQTPDINVEPKKNYATLEPNWLRPVTDAIQILQLS
jgi:hypothetical protein